MTILVLRRLVAVLPLLLAFAAQAQQVQYSLSTTSLLEGPNAGSDGAIVYGAGLTGLMPTTPAVSASWITLIPNDPNSSTAMGFKNGPNYLRFQFAANTGSTRTATIYLGGFGPQSTSTLTITQAASSFAPAGLVTLAVAQAGVYPTLHAVNGIAVDSAGNLWVADTAQSNLLEWNAATQQLLLGPGLYANQPAFDIAVDSAGNKLVLEVDSNTRDPFVYWYPTTGGSTQLYASQTIRSAGLCIDPAGQNVYVTEAANAWECAIDSFGDTYVTDVFDNNLGRNPQGAAQLLFPLGSTPTPSVYAIVADQNGFLYFGDNSGQTLKRFDPAQYQIVPGQPFTRTGVTTLATGIFPSYRMAVDSSRNFYFSQTMAQQIQELPNAFVSPQALNEGAAAGSDSIQVMPASQSLTGVYAPVAGATWLTVGTASNGLVSFSFSANTGGQRTATITILGAPVTITQAASQTPAAIQITAGNNQTAAVGGAPFAANLQVQVKNAFGNPLSGVSVTFSSTGVNVGSGVASTDANGYASISATPYSTGPLTVTATVTGTSISQTFNLTGVGWGLVAVTGDGQQSLVNYPFPTNLKVLLSDQNANPVPNQPVTFTAFSGTGGATFAGGISSSGTNTVIVMTGSDGTATAPTLTASGIPGAFTVTANNGVSSGARNGQAHFNSLTVYNIVNKVAGDNNSTIVNTTFGTNLQVLVINENGLNMALPGSGTPIQYTIVPNQNGASASFAGANSVTVPADLNGISTAPPLTANSIAGTFTVTATNIGSSGGTQTFTLTNTLPAGNVTSYVSITSSALVYNRAAGAGTETLTIRNTSAVTLPGPLALVLAINNPAVTAKGQSGIYQTNPYWTIPGNSLAPGASTTVTVSFSYPVGTGFATTPSVYAGGLQ
jgi:hypothetical protein